VSATVTSRNTNRVAAADAAARAVETHQVRRLRRLTAAAPMLSASVTAYWAGVCEQPVAVQLADRDAVAERFRPFIGSGAMRPGRRFSAPRWSSKMSRPDGTARSFMSSGRWVRAGAPRADPRTGIIRDGSSGSRIPMAANSPFGRFNADLAGRLVTPIRPDLPGRLQETP